MSTAFLNFCSLYFHSREPLEIIQIFFFFSTKKTVYFPRQLGQDSRARKEILNRYHSHTHSEPEPTVFKIEQSGAFYRMCVTATRTPATTTTIETGTALYRLPRGPPMEGACVVMVGDHARNVACLVRCDATFVLNCWKFLCGYFQCFTMNKKHFISCHVSKTSEKQLSYSNIDIKEVDCSDWCRKGIQCHATFNVRNKPPHDTTKIVASHRRDAHCFGRATFLITMLTTTTPAGSKNKSCLLGRLIEIATL